MAGKRCYGCMNIKTSSPVCEHCGYNEYAGNEPHQLPCGTLLQGQYTVGKVLGQGGFGITYIGWDHRLNIPVAIKEFYPSGFVNRDCRYSLSLTTYENQQGEFLRNTRERFIREAQTLARLSGVPEVVHVRNFFEANNTAYIIMEYIQGVDLRRYVKMRGGRLTPQETLTILEPITRALIQIHNAGIIHRDISPDNIMLLPGGGAKLLDFGAVRAMDVTDPNGDLPKSTEAILKHGFAPIEQYQRRGAIGPWTDQYAFCATIYYCITGRVPTEATERLMEESINWHTIPGLLPHQAAALDKGMAIRASDRYPDVRELARQLYAPQQATVPQQPPKEDISKKPVDPPKFEEVQSIQKVIHDEVMSHDPQKPNGLLIALVAVAIGAAVLFGTMKKAPKPSEPSLALPTESVTMETQDSPGEGVAVPTGTEDAVPMGTEDADPIAQAEVGDYVFFGSYPQTRDGREMPIEWLVLDKTEGGMLLMSRYGLDCVKYDDQGGYTGWNPDAVSWDACSLSRWLNDDFYSRAFGREEQERIRTLRIYESSSYTYRVYILSEAEVSQYLPTRASRQCWATDYALKMGASAMAASDGCSWWWLRSDKTAAKVPDVDSDGSLSTARVNGEKAVVRPAIWILY